ncbi:MAG: isocitrate lyase/phosphoenolpyruvate mutase family protein [Chitinophagaceae bacterium]
MTPSDINQKEKTKIFHQLHHNEKLLVLPNIWDPLGAILLESLGYPAVATASASISYSNGYNDGEQISFPELLLILQKIVNSVKIPVTADIESGYAINNSILKENIKKLVDTGIAGINFEDSRHDAKDMVSVREQCEKITIIKKAAIENGTALFINARTDVYIKGNNLSEEEQLIETIMRGKAYKDAGADSFYPIVLTKKETIERIVDEVDLPINILLLPGIPGFESLEKMGVARLSLGPGFLKTAINAMKNVAEKLLNHEGMEEVTNIPISFDYLTNLISKT